MNRLLPEDSVVGSWDAGIIAYFSRFPVVNLDGLVSSYDYSHATNVAKDRYAGWDKKFIPPLSRIEDNSLTKPHQPHEKGI